MKTIKKILLAGTIAALFATFSTAHAQVVRVANRGDVLSMDPHALNESLQLSLTGNIYEPLVGRNKDLSLAPGLATGWKQVAPTVWQFPLRQGVLFHDGTPFTADDVVFSLERASGEGSDLRSFTSNIQAVRKLDDFLVEIETKTPYSVLPDALTLVYIMSRSWCETHQSVRPVAPGPAGEGAALVEGAASQANGTGPFRLGERQPGVRTVFVRNPAYWGKVEGNVREVVFTPMADDRARVDALLDGRVDVMEPVPVADVARVNTSAAARAVTGPELRTMLFGMDQRRDELPGASVKGANPFKDKRVRQAFYQAIDIDNIRRNVMRGASSPAALLVGPGVNGFPADANKRLAYDPARARRLLAEAGYPDGFQLTLDCPNDRYVEDALICAAVASDLARVGVRATVLAQPKARYFPKILARESGFYLLGWTPGTYDALDALNALAVCPDGSGAGQYNLGGYCNPRLDALVQRIRPETDKTRRNALIQAALELHAEDIGHLPLHQQALSWGVSKKVTLVQLPDNFMHFKWMGSR